MFNPLVDEPLDKLSGAVCALGVFDGVHLGHSQLILQALFEAEIEGKESVIITFDIDPDEVFKPKTHVKIQSNANRIKALESLGATYVVVLPFVPEFYSLSPIDFLDKTFGKNIPTRLFVGDNFHFGARGAGDTQTLEKWAELHGMGVCTHDLYKIDDVVISSTQVRIMLAAHDIDSANKLLGRMYCACGTVQKGRQQGQDMGFRTANIELPENERPIADGVYAGYVPYGGKIYKAAISVGVSPTFEDSSTANIEAHILDFSEDIYGQEISVCFSKYLREMRKFDCVDELIATVNKDIESARNLPDICM